MFLDEKLKVFYEKFWKIQNESGGFCRPVSCFSAQSAFDS